MTNGQTKTLTSTLLALYAIVLYLCSTMVQRGDTWLLLSVFALLSGLYLLLLRSRSALTFWQLMGAALLLRLAVSTNLPWLTDDFCRFLWDGRMTHIGLHPFALTPQQTGVRNDLYHLLNSQRFFTVYPVVCQVVFYLGAFGKSLFASISIMRTLLLGAELCTIALLARKRGNEVAALYALHPLAIMEVCGNLHFEGVAVVFLVAMFAVLSQPGQASKLMFPFSGKGLRTTLYFSLAIATKLNPLLIAPILAAHFKGKQAVWFAFFTALFTALLFAPIAYQPEYIAHMTQSLQLYFRDFQINASVFYLCNAVYTWYVGFGGAVHIIPILSLATVALIGYLSWRVWRGTLHVADAVTWAFLVHLVLSTTVHPWYILLPLATSMFADARLRKLCIAWSLLMFLSYSHYGGEVYVERYGFLVAEYAALVGCGWWLYGRKVGPALPKK